MNTPNNPSDKIVYFVRHGQSEANVLPIFQPLESPLSDVGKLQAQKIAERVANISFEALIVSPLVRTKETAEAITRATGKQPEYSELFVERVKPPELCGKPFSDPEASALWDKWKESLFTPGMRVDGGENFDDLDQRAELALDFLAKRPEKELVVVTHGFFLRTLMTKVLLGDALTPEACRSIQSRATMENTGITVLKHITDKGDPYWRLWIYNDHAHLG